MVKRIVLLISIFVLAACQSTSNDLPKYEEFVGAGDLLPITSIKSINGDEIDLQNSNKKKLVVLFATWCSDSNRLIRALNQSEILTDENIEVVAIAREEDTDTVKAWRDKLQLKMPLAVDPDRSIYKRFAVGGIPRLIMVANDNSIIKMNLAEGYNQLAKIQW
jgi:peroxiredoxin